MSQRWKMPALLAGLVLAAAAHAAESPAHNVILFVPDGLRALDVTPQATPAMAEVRDQGVNFRNPHSLFPTFTMPNAAGMATGHHLGDTGAFGNTIYTGFQVPGAGNSLTPFTESDPVLGDIDEHFAGDYLNEETLLKAARAKGLSTATIGKLGPALMFDHTERSGNETIIVDDSTGSPAGIPLSAEVKAALTAAGLPVAAPSRGENGKAGDFQTPGTKVANVAQQNYFTEVATKIVLPMFKARNRPFALVFWSRDPDGTMHNQGDSLNALTPGINGPTSLAAMRNADDNLRQLRQALADLGLAETTDIVIAADHGFSTISKQSETSTAAKASYADVPAGFLPPGFVAIDLARALDLPLADPDAKDAPVGLNAHPKRGNGLLGRTPEKPDVVVAANGGADLVYVPSGDRALAARVAEILLRQDYVSGLFVDDDLGPLPGTLPLSAIHLKGKAITPYPAIVVNFRSFATGCEEPLLCTVAIADSVLQQGQGMHGSFSRADTMNFMAAIGPDFRAGFVDPAPASNADVGKTLAHILGVKPEEHGKLVGRVLDEVMPGGGMPTAIARTLRSAPAENGLVTVLITQEIGDTRYFDVAGFPGRSVGLENAKRADR